MELIESEIEFTLPSGYMDANGIKHKEGLMRKATAGDEILPKRDPRVQKDPSYLSIIILSRVITKLGTLDMVNTSVIEDLYSNDLAFLKNLYNQINQEGE